VRYPTLGTISLSDAQPFFYRRPGVIMAHNGNVTNYARIIRDLAARSVRVLSTCDVEPMLLIFAEALMDASRSAHTAADVQQALKTTFDEVQGAYTMAAALTVDGRDTLMVCRDPHGIRPGVWGERDGTFIAASESVALDALDIRCKGDIPPGKAILLRAGAEPVFLDVKTESNAQCVFEEIYFARPDSVMGGHTVYERRLLLGRLLARQWKERGLECDRVIPVPDTSRPAAMAFAEELKVPCREGFIKNRYSGRTFIMPDSDSRESGLRLKLNPIREEFDGMRVAIMDDSIVRGSTIGRIVDLVRQQGAREVHVVIHSPPVMFPCYYGIDMSTPEELVARQIYGPAPGPHRLEEAREVVESAFSRFFDVDSLTYLSVETLRQVENGGRCAACFDGAYPVEIPACDREDIEANRRRQGVRCASVGTRGSTPSPSFGTRPV
jgi:amidophosphoribosyltransferase